jgi:RNA polymerase sigma-70 factor, ECF subfamily
MSRCLSKTERRPNAPVTTPRYDAGKIGPQAARTDEELLAEYAAKQTREAFEELVHRYEREMYNYLRRYLRSAELAEDAFQAAFLGVHLKCRDFDPSRKFRPWLYRIATTRAIDLLRQNRRHKAVSLNTGEGTAAQDVLRSREAGPGEQVEAAEDRERIRSAVDRFPTRLKGVLVLVMFQGFKCREAAEILGIPLGSVKSRLHEAVLRLRATFMAT